MSMQCGPLAVDRSNYAIETGAVEPASKAYLSLARNRSTSYSTTSLSPWPVCVTCSEFNFAVILVAQRGRVHSVLGGGGVVSNVTSSHLDKGETLGCLFAL